MAKIIFAIGSDVGDKSKRWAWYKWIELERLLKHSNIQVEYLGTTADEMPTIKTPSFEQLCRAIVDADLIVCNDNGLMHVTDYLEVPTLMIAGPTSVIKNQPLNGYVIKGECHKDFKDGCYHGAKVKCKKRPLPCLAKIGVRDVYCKIQAIFGCTELPFRAGQSDVQQCESFIINPNYCQAVRN